MPFTEARAAPIAELERNLGKWAATGGSDPALYRFKTDIDTVTCGLAG
jgi:hypothetical protein